MNDEGCGREMFVDWITDTRGTSYSAGGDDGCRVYGSANNLPGKASSIHAGIVCLHRIG